MLDLEQLQTVGQLVDNIEMLMAKLEKAFDSNNSEEFARIKKDISVFNDKINQLVNQR